MTSAGGVSYVYDANGVRVQKSGGTMYLFDPQGEVVDEVSSGYSIENEYVYFGGRRIARRDGSGNVTYLFSDQIGSSRVITDSSGNVCYDADFYPFGGERAYTTSCAQNYKFTGQERDAESNLDNFIARFYSSAEGHFMSPDPLAGDIGDPQSLNRYAYVRNNPLTLTDPTGMDASCDDGSCGGCDFLCGIGIDFGGWSPPSPAPTYNPPNPSGDPNPPAGDPDPNGSFSGPIWQEGGPQIPLQNLAQLLGVPDPPTLIFDATDNANQLPAAQTQIPTWLLQADVFLSVLGQNFANEFKPNGCFPQFANELATGQAADASPPGAGQEDVVRTVGQAAATTYVIAKQLPYPLKSSIYRRILGLTETAAGVLTLAPLDYEAWNAFVHEMQSLRGGTCK